MASISLNQRGKYRVEFTFDGKRKAIQLPTADKKAAQTIANMVERLIEQKQTGQPDRQLSNWLKDIPDDLRAQKAAPKVLEALTGSNTQENNNVLYNVQQRTLQHSGSGRYIAVSDKKDDLSLENREYYKKTKSPREIMQGHRIGAEGLEQDAKDPRKQGLLSDGDNSTTYFTTYPDYFEQIIDLFDKLEADEQAALLEVLKERAAAV